MRIEQRGWTQETGWQVPATEPLGERASLVLAFGAKDLLDDPTWFDGLRATYPNAQIVTASTAGEIHGTQVRDGSLSVTAVEFEHGSVSAVSVDVQSADESHAAGRQLARALAAASLHHVVVISEGLRINGTELANGLRENLPAGVVVTGGLAGDGARMEHTVVGLNAPPREGQVVALGFHGERLHVGYGSLGGWDTFGPERLITRSRDNVLYELDGTSALDLYKSYLGEHASGLPATGLLFPLALRKPDGQDSVVRTILGVDESSHSMTFAGDVPEGTYARLMKANFDHLIDGAAGAAQSSQQGLAGSEPQLALLISCVGRKLILRQRTEEEVESVLDVLGAQTALTGFYSYGEICPHLASVECELHNQTMTITTFSER